MQPGDLDGHRTSSSDESAQGAATTSTTVETERGEASTEAGAQVTTSTTAPPATTTTAPAAETTTTLAGSGLGVATSPTGGTDGIAETGMESMLGPGLGLLAFALAGRRLTTRR